MSDSSDYRDYVFKNGQFIAAFDDMYLHSEEVPWHQDQNALGIFSDLDITILRHFHRATEFTSLLDIGCGLGFMTERIRTEVACASAPELTVYGIDISPTAIRAASKKFSHISFEAVNILKDNVNHLSKQFDVVFAKEVMWYVLADLDGFFKKLESLSKRFIYISQSFPGLDQYTGQDIFPNAQALEDFIGHRSIVIYSVIEKDSKYNFRELIHVFAELRD